MKPHKLHKPHLGQKVLIHWQHTDVPEAGFVSFIGRTWFDVFIEGKVAFTFRKSTLKDVGSNTGIAELGERDPVTEEQLASLVARS